METVFVVIITEYEIPCSPNTFKKLEDAKCFIEDCLERKGVRIDTCETEMLKIPAETIDKKLLYVTYIHKGIVGELIECELR